MGAQLWKSRAKAALAFLLFWCCCTPPVGAVPETGALELAQAAQAAAPLLPVEPAPAPQAFAVFIREDPEAPWVFGEEAGGPRVGGLLHLELTLKQVKDQLREALTQLTDLASRARYMERRQQSQRPSFAELAREMQQVFSVSCCALTCYLVEYFNTYLTNNPIAACLCCPFHFLACFCSVCYYWPCALSPYPVEQAFQVEVA